MIDDNIYNNIINEKNIRYHLSKFSELQLAEYYDFEAMTDCSLF